MKIFRLTRMALIAVIMCVNFSACREDDEPIAENQYKEDGHINPQYSSATYKYEIIGNKQAKLTSRNFIK